MMPNPVASTQLLCQQCSAVLPVTQGSAYATCEYCGTVNYLNKSEAVLHYAVRPMLDEAGARAALRSWMAGNDTVKGLEDSAQIDQLTYQLFPLWLVRTDDNGRERVFTRPAAAVASTELSAMDLPAGSLVAYDPSLDADAVRPTVPLTTLRSWLLADEGIAADAIREIALVHIPFYLFGYIYGGQHYTVRVDAAGGDVLAVIYPRKSETPYVTVGGLGCLAYLAIALIPGIAYLISGGSGLTIGLLIYLAAAVALAIPIFAAAARTSQQH